MTPEPARGADSREVVADPLDQPQTFAVYQLGAVLYKLFIGRLPFEGQPAMVMNPALTDQPGPPSAVADVPPEVDDVLHPALAKEKDERYESVLSPRRPAEAFGIAVAWRSNRDVRKPSAGEGSGGYACAGQQPRVGTNL